MSLTFNQEEQQILKDCTPEQREQLAQLLQSKSINNMREAQAILEEISKEEEDQFILKRGIEFSEINEDRMYIAGHEIFPMSLGIQTLLESIEHPMWTGKGIEAIDQCVLFWCLTNPKEIVREVAKGGKDALYEKGEEFSYDITAEALLEFFEKYVNPIMGIIDDSVEEPVDATEKKTKKKK